MKNTTRARRKASPNPSPSEIARAREVAQLTQTQAAEKIYSTMRTWQDWEAGARRCHPAMFELFLIKTGQLQR